MFIEFLTLNITTRNLQNLVLRNNSAYNVDYPYDLYGLKCFQNFGNVHLWRTKNFFMVFFAHLAFNSFSNNFRAYTVP